MLENNVLWKPLEGAQTLALTCRCNEILFQGTRGSAKTDAQLFYFYQFVGLGFGEYWNGIIFDREYKNLDDIIKRSKLWFSKIDGARFIGGNQLKWVFSTGEELLFRAVKKEDDYYNFHGHERPFIGWNELTKYPTPVLYDAMMSINRSPYPNIPLVIFSTSNPFGAGHNWVKKKFINPAESGTIIRNTKKVFNPRTQQEEEITKTQVSIFGSYKENKYLPPEYILELESIKDENKRKAWLYGDWDIIAGGAFDDIWSRKLILPRFKIPENWRIDRSFDWGSTHPFSVGWWTVSNGEDVELENGDYLSIPANTLIRIFEWYGAKNGEHNTGLKMSSTNIAKRILEIEAKLLKDGWIKTKPLAGAADNQIHNNNEEGTDSIAKKMESVGVRWAKSDKSKGSRINGLELMRGAMESAINGEKGGLMFMDNCRHAISQLPVLPRDPKNPDDVDTESEDHLYDECRYRVLQKAREYHMLNVGM